MTECPKHKRRHYDSEPCSLCVFERERLEIEELRKEQEPYRVVAREMALDYDGTLYAGDGPVDIVDDGAYVLAWLFVPNSALKDAGQKSQ